MRSRNLVASAALTAAIALVALPGSAGSRNPSPDQIFDPAAFHTVLVNAKPDGASLSSDLLDPAYRSAGRLDEATDLVETGLGAGAAATASRPSVDQPPAPAGVTIRKPRYTLTGYATFYDNGTTAMKLPRGTIIRVCGSGGCVERVVNDYGPFGKGRIVDLYRPDFFAVCGCPSFAGTTKVTVSVY